MTDSFFISETISYYVGKLSTVTNSSPLKTFTQSVGYLMAFDISETCVVYTNSYGTSISMTSNPLSFTTTAVTTAT